MKRAIQLLTVLAASTGIIGCSTAPDIVVPSCDRPAWLDGKFDPAVPGFTVTLIEGVTDAPLVARELAQQYSFELDDQNHTAIEGFAVRMLTPEGLAALRCDPRVLGVSYTEHIRMRPAR